MASLLQKSDGGLEVMLQSAVVANEGKDSTLQGIMELCATHVSIPKPPQSEWQPVGKGGKWKWRKAGDNARMGATIGKNK